MTQAAQEMTVLPKGVKPKTFWHSDSAARAVNKRGWGPGISLSYHEHDPRLL